ncbi:hypothetical protein WICPIJ_005024 [Wickerhamomyces pijperi]|uniref:non-specific serine/threonine protein kinase n=1 Tax=Wickerhamomyces pijperi TaxID=599730 RepID=A0A9P8TM76_WICPI|nr:hypothetical protein WICPIJ_005024 [Wickerhamomyces pijperi]
MQFKSVVVALASVAAVQAANSSNSSNNSNKTSVSVGAAASNAMGAGVVGAAVAAGYKSCVGPRDSVGRVRDASKTSIRVIPGHMTSTRGNSSFKKLNNPATNFKMYTKTHKSVTQIGFVVKPDSTKSRRLNRPIASSIHLPACLYLSQFIISDTIQLQVPHQAPTPKYPQMNETPSIRFSISKDTIRHVDNTESNPADLYSLKECIGKGNFGDVYRAVEKSTRNIYAIKVINLEDTDDDLSVLFQEISFLSQLRSEYITNYYQTVTTDVFMWIVMEYCGGGSCADLLKCHKQLSEDVVCFIVRDTLKGLEYLHSQNKIHRDIKAANILLTSGGLVKLADFGVSGQITTFNQKKDTFVGTPFWMAPEVINRRSGYNEKVDLWSLGITAIELLTGSPPHSDREPMKVLFEIPKIPPPLLVGEKYSELLKDFIKCCLTKNPKHRPSAEELLKHKFIRGCKRGISLVPLIQVKDQWMASHRPHRRPKYNLLKKLYDDSEATLRWNFTRKPKQILSEIYQAGLPGRNNATILHVDNDDMYQLNCDMNNTAISDYGLSNNNSPESDQISPMNENYLDSGETCLTSPESQPSHQQSYTKHKSKVQAVNNRHSPEEGSESPTAIIHSEEKTYATINYIDDVVMHCLQKVHLRARLAETKAVVVELSRAIKHADNQQPGLAEALSEEIWLRMVELRGERFQAK